MVATIQVYIFSCECIVGIGFHKCILQLLTEVSLMLIKIFYEKMTKSCRWTAVRLYLITI